MWDWISELKTLKDSGKPFAMLTVTRCRGSTPRDPGAKMFVFPEARSVGTLGGGNFEQLAIAEARHCLELRVNKTERYPLGAKAGQCCGGEIEVWIETLNVGPRLYLFGAGHVGQAVCQVLTETPFQIYLVDERPEWINSLEVSKAVFRHPESWEEFIEKQRWDLQTYVVIMTHSHALDQSILERTIKLPSRFIGLIGSEAKWNRFRTRLQGRGFSDGELSRVKCPIGIPIGGKTPKEVAISLAAELISLVHEENQLPYSAPTTGSRAIHPDASTERPLPVQGTAMVTPPVEVLQ